MPPSLPFAHSAGRAQPQRVASGRPSARRPDLAIVLSALVAGCSIDLAPLVGDPPDANSSGAAPGVDAGLAGSSAWASAGGLGAPTGDGGTNGNGKDGGGGGEAGGTGGGAGASGTGAAGATPAFVCHLSSWCEPELAPHCLCNGCATYCIEETDYGVYESDCLCPDCFDDPGCQSCNYDGRCDPEWERCTCADCAQHPLC
jgi:hypothetical protein